MRQLILLLLASIALQSTASGQAQETDSGQPRWFQIELLFFRNLSAAAQQEEHWPEEIDIWSPEPSYQLPALAQMGDTSHQLQLWEPPVLQIAGGEQQPEEAAQVVSDELLQYRGVAGGDTPLKKIKTRLQNRRDYQVLDYRAWRQPLAPDGAPVYFRVATGKTRDLYHELEGYIGVYLRRFLHVDMELWWGDYALPTNLADTSSPPVNDTTSPPANTEGPGTAPNEREEPSQPETFSHRRVLRAAHLREQRRMRSDEVHYFDHPLMGMLVRISPLKESE